MQSVQIHIRKDSQSRLSVLSKSLCKAKTLLSDVGVHKGPIGHTWFTFYLVYRPFVDLHFFCFQTKIMLRQAKDYNCACVKYNYWVGKLV